MPYDHIDRAIRRRFFEASRFNLGTQLQQRAASDRSPTDTFDEGWLSMRTPELKIQSGREVHRVPVLAFDKQGQDVETWPAITYMFEEERFGADIYEYSTSRTRTYGNVAVTTPYGTEVSGPDIIRTYPAGDPIWLQYSFRVWSKNDRTAGTLLRVLKSLFPARGHLDIGIDEGCCTYVAAMFRTSGPRWRGNLQPALPEGDPGMRFYSYELVYEIHAREDTSLMYSDDGTIRSRQLETVDIDLGSIEVYNPDTPDIGE